MDPRLGASSVPRIDEIAINGEVLLFTLAISLGSGCSLAWRRHCGFARGSAGTPQGCGPRLGRRGSVWASGGNLRRLLVMSELALSVVLLIGAGLLIRSFARVQDVPPGFNPAERPDARADDDGPAVQRRAAVLEAYRQLWERLRRCQASRPRAA